MAAPPWAPSPAAVAHHLRKFTRDVHGQDLAEDAATPFTEATMVRLSEVVAAIGEITLDVITETGTAIPEELHDQAGAVAALGAAAQAVVDLDGDLSGRLGAMYEARLARLIKAVHALRDGVQQGSVPASGSWPRPFGVSREHF